MEVVAARVPKQHPERLADGTIPLDQVNPPEILT